jgi:hypothetical protein
LADRQAEYAWEFQLKVPDAVKIGRLAGTTAIELQSYISRRSHEVEQDLKETLASLRAYRRRDPAFKQAIAAAAKAEAQRGRSDPLDGEIVIG